MSDSVDRLVEQARKLPPVWQCGKENNPRLAEAVSVARALAAEVEQLDHGWNSAMSDLERTLRERNEARARVAALEAEIRVHRDVIRARDRNNPPHIHLGTSAQSPNERLWALLEENHDER